MATSLSKIKNQIEKLQKQAESIQFTVISRIKKDIAQHGLTVDDLFGSSSSDAVGKSTVIQSRKSSKPKKAVADKPAKFADDKGNTWHGVGKRPQWIHDLLSAGRNLEEYLVGKRKPAAAPHVKSPAKVNGKKAPAKKAAATQKPVLARKTAATKTSKFVNVTERAGDVAPKKRLAKKSAKPVSAVALAKRVELPSAES